jgi:hypothetical protein
LEVSILLKTMGLIWKKAGSFYEEPFGDGNESEIISFPNWYPG